MGYVVDRWHKSRPREDEPFCGAHKGKVASAAHGKGKRWQARYSGPDGNERSSLHRTVVEAEAEIIKQESAKLDGTWVDPAKGKMKIERLIFDLWLPGTDANERTRREYRGVMNRYVLPEWEGRQVRSITPPAARAWQGLLSTKYELGGSTPNRVARLVRAPFNMAVVDRIIPISPFADLKAPTLIQPVINPPDVRTVQLIVEQAHHDRWAVMTELDAITGWRSGEIRGLRLPEVDLATGLVDIVAQMVYEPGKGLFLDKLKTDSGRRTSPLNARGVELLSWYIAKYPPPTTGPWAGLIFTMPDGKPIGESTLDWALKAMCRKAGVKPYRWHDLRHHFASVLIAGGENPKVVQRRLGHKDVLTTLRIYTHMWEEAESRTRSVLDGAWAEVRAHQGPTAERVAALGSLVDAAQGLLPEGVRSAVEQEVARLIKELRMVELPGSTGRIPESGGANGPSHQVEALLR